MDVISIHCTVLGSQFSLNLFSFSLYVGANGQRTAAPLLRWDEVVERLVMADGCASRHGVDVVGLFSLSFVY